MNSIKQNSIESNSRSAHLPFVEPESSLSGTIDHVLDWILDLLTTYTHNSELQVITAPSLISTLCRSPQHMPSLFQPAMSSSAVPW
jgi:hypothetical protein